ncbi:MAG: DMT family transporter [Anaerolineaceae bacterium]|nr:DMT family transporter [Anaerolineaceae bacterium]
MGEIASLLTSIFWVLTSILFTAAGEKVGSKIVNRVRILFALVLLSLTNLVMFGEVLPFSAAGDRWTWLALSGFVGLAAGDAFLFQSFLHVGPRLSMLVMASVPVLSTLMAWIFLGEQLAPFDLFGIVVAVLGILFVVSENVSASAMPRGKKHYWLGILFSLLGALGQSGGMILAKKGLYDGFNVVSGSLIRTLTATIVLWIWALLAKEASPTVKKLVEDRKALGLIFVGTLVGPFIGVWLSLIGVQSINVGIASTLQGLAPIIMLPVGYFFYKEKISLRAILGTVVTLGGVATIFLLGG